jgi:Glucose-6-phosphate dehydrogenase, C-terminal domain
MDTADDAGVPFIFGSAGDLTEVPPFPFGPTLIGNRTRFVRQDGIDEEWRIVQPLLDKPPAVYSCEPGGCGPSAADQLVSANGGWCDSGW